MFHNVPLFFRKLYDKVKVQCLYATTWKEAPFVLEAYLVTQNGRKEQKINEVHLFLYWRQFEKTKQGAKKDKSK